MKNKQKDIIFIKWLVVVVHIFLLLILLSIINQKVPAFVEANNKDKIILLYRVMFSGLILYMIINNLIFLWYMKYSKNFIMSLQEDFLEQAEDIKDRDKIIDNLNEYIDKQYKQMDKMQDLNNKMVELLKDESEEIGKKKQE